MAESHCKFRLWKCLMLARLTLTAVTESHCKFRLWKCLSYPQGSETAVTESHCKFRLWNYLRLARLALSAGIKTCMVLIVQIYMSILPFMREQ